MGSDHIISKLSAIRFPDSSVCNSKSAPTRSSPQWNTKAYLYANNPLPINHQPRILNTIGARYLQVCQPSNDLVPWTSRTQGGDAISLNQRVEETTQPRELPSSSPSTSTRTNPPTTSLAHNAYLHIENRRKMIVES